MVGCLPPVELSKLYQSELQRPGLMREKRGANAIDNLWNGLRLCEA